MRASSSTSDESSRTCPSGSVGAGVGWRLSPTRKGTLEWGSTDRKLRGSSSNRRACAGSRSPRPEVSAARCGRGFPPLPCVVLLLFTYPATLLLLRAGLYLAGGGVPLVAKLAVCRDTHQH